MFEPVQAINIQNDLYILNHIKYYSSELSFLKKVLIKYLSWNQKYLENEWRFDKFEVEGRKNDHSKKK